jgi:uncharacterized protein (TIGR02118 family)
MHCLTVLYPTPDDPVAFRDYYVATHVPLARTLPGLLSCTYAFPERMGGSDAPFCLFQAFFADAAAMGAALQSEIGGRVAADVPNYSPKGASLCHFEMVS